MLRQEGSIKFFEGNTLKEIDAHKPGAEVDDPDNYVVNVDFYPEYVNGDEPHPFEGN